MIFKVFFQEFSTEVPVRERTKSMYVEAGSETEVRRKLKDHNYNIEFVTKLEGAFLEYEQQSADYELENV